MKILSLFDGISCGRVALQRAGINVERYVAYEIDEDAIIVSNWNWPDIEHKGTVEGADFTQYAGFDMVIGGFPCTDLSTGKNNRQGLKGKHSRLFWEQVRAIKEINPRYFLPENNYGMPKKDEEIITETLGVKPIYINSALLSAQTRKRLYWTNIPGVQQPEDLGVMLRDILEPAPALKYYHSDKGVNYLFDEKYDRVCRMQGTKEKSNAITAGYSKGLPLNVFAEKVNASVRVGDIGKGSQATRVYSPTGKSVCLTSSGGGMGAKTGLYAIGCAIRTWPRNTKIDRHKRPEVQVSGKANAITTVNGDSMVIEGPKVPLFLVDGGFMGYKGRRVPVKLSDGYYAIRKLTPVECERLQTLPDGYTEMVSDTQRYRQLGNGWTVDVIAHILNYINLDELL